MMRTWIRGIVGLTLCSPAIFAQSADEIIAKYIATIGGMEKIQSVTSLRRIGKFYGGGGFQAKFVQENKRSNFVREELITQGLTGIKAYDGKTGWKIEPWSGKKDPEALGEEELKSIVEDSDFDGPLLNYRQKGNKVEFLGMEPVEGTDALKLRVTVPDGDTYLYYLDTEYYVPIKIETKRNVQGEEREYEMSLGDYKEVSGWYLPYSFEGNVKGSSDKWEYVFEKIEVNVPLDDNRFTMPATGPKAKP